MISGVSIGLTASIDLIVSIAGTAGMIHGVGIILMLGTTHGAGTMVGTILGITLGVGTMAGTTVGAGIMVGITAGVTTTAHHLGGTVLPIIT